MNSGKGILVVLSGFSGAGKGTVVKKLMESYDTYALSISATTRQPRVGEEEGKSYFFKTVEEFEKMIEEDKLLEYANYVGNYYGTPADYVNSMLKSGKNVLLEIEIQGAMKIKEKNPDAVLVFLTPPTADELKNRLTNRGTEDLATVEKRLSRAGEESNGIENYDYILVNDDLDTCVKEFNEIVVSEKKKTFRNREFISEIQNEVSKFKK